MEKIRTILCVIGTRPEAIKMVPVIRALEASGWAKCVVVVTAQHRDMLDQMLTRFGVIVKHDLNLMQPGQTLSQVVSRMLPELENIIKKEQPYAVVAQGDTATVFGSALAAFHCQTPFGHVEAGLRTHNLAHPFPEEGYRQMVSRITHWHFAPTEGAAKALRTEGIPDNKIFVTGNTCIDTLLQTVKELPQQFDSKERTILLTAHRRENFGKPLENIFNAVLEILDRFHDVSLLYPVHPNPNVQQLAHDMLGKHPRVKLTEPLDYFDFVGAMRSAYLILTDSGGVQEEAPALGKPVLVLREITERPEPVNEGVAKLVGTTPEAIVSQVSLLLESVAEYEKMGRLFMPYGDGVASTKIVRQMRGA
jgi:UDP-N-acetylglucosamine 2-epimerase (non-hydrolysing)